MKKIIIATAVVIAGVSVWKLNLRATEVSSQTHLKAVETSKVFNADKAKELGQLADRVALAKMPELDVSNLSKDELDQKLKEIDDRLGDESLVERVNRNQLSESELIEVRALLHLRAKYFSRRVQLALSKT